MKDRISFSFLKSIKIPYKETLTFEKIDIKKYKLHFFKEANRCKRC